MLAELGDTAPAVPHRETRRWHALPLVTLSLLVFLQLRWIDEPFDSSMGGIVSGQFVAYSVRAFSELGVARTGLVWTHFFHPDEVELLVPYLNHPVFSLLLLYPSYEFLGRSEAALRMPVLIIAVLGAVAFFALLRRFREAAWVAVATALYLSAPLMVQHAMILCPFGIIGTSFALGAAAAWFWWRIRGGGGPYLLFAVLGTASLAMDWAAGFLLPGLLVALFLQRGGGGRLRAIVGTVAPYALALALLALWFVTEAGGAAGALEHLRILRMRLRDYPAGFPHWLGSMGAYVRLGLGWPLLVLAILGMLRSVSAALRGRASMIDGIGLGLLVWGILPSVVFYPRAANHEFWIFSALPAVAILATGGLEFVVGGITRSARTRAAVLVLASVIVAGLGFWWGAELHERARSDRCWQRAAAIDSLTGRGDVVVLIDVGNSVPYYAAASVMTLPGANRLVFDQAVHHLEKNRGAIRHIVLAVPEAALEVSQSWVSDLPLLMDTARILPYAGTKLFAVELDAERLFAR